MSNVDAPLPNLPAMQIVNGVVSQLSQTEFLQQNPKTEAQGSVTVGGSATSGNKVSVQITHPLLAGGSTIATATAGSSLSATATAVAAAINVNTALETLGLGASASGDVVSIVGDGAVLNDVEISAWVVSSTQNATVGGTFTEGETVGITFTNANLDDGSLEISHEIVSGDTNTDGVASALETLINANSQLEDLGITATVDDAVISVDIPATIGAVTLAGISGAEQTITMSGAQTETVSVTQFSGGSGPIIPTETFSFRWNGVSIIFQKGVPSIVESDLLAALVAAGMPIS